MELHPVDRRRLPHWINVDVWPARDGWPHRRFSVAADPDALPRGSLIFQTGRADFFEKYIEILAHWRRRGWSIEGFDWRGQGGSGRISRNAADRDVSYPLLVDDLAAYVGEWRRRVPPPHILVGHSMGGHLALRYLAERPVIVDGAVLLSPMLGIVTPFPNERVASVIAWAACRAGLGDRALWKESEARFVRRQRNLTHDRDRFADELWWRKHDPMLDLGPPSWSWLRDSFESIASLSRHGGLRDIRIPLLILYSERDRLVSARATRRIAAGLPDARVIGHPTAAHELLREVDGIRQWALGKIDDFLETMIRFK